MARALFTEGVEHARNERYAEAVDQFTRAQAIYPAPAIAFNLASALVRLGRLVEASEHLRWVLRREDTAAEMRDASQVMLDELTPRLGRVSVRLTGDHEDVLLRIDDRPLDRAAIGVAVPMDPGHHVIAALRGDEPVARAELTLAEGAVDEITLDVPAAPEAPAPIVHVEEAPVEPAPVQGESFEWLLWTTIAVVVAGAAAVTTTLLVLDQQSAVAEPVPGTTIPPVLEWD